MMWVRSLSARWHGSGPIIHFYAVAEQIIGIMNLIMHSGLALHESFLSDSDFGRTYEDSILRPGM